MSTSDKEYSKMAEKASPNSPKIKNCIKAFANTEHQVIMSIGNLVDVKELGELPENISVHTFVDQIAVLNQADVFLSHCGMNSVSESLYYEVPLVMLPQTNEQTVRNEDDNVHTRHGRGLGFAHPFDTS